jgi:metallo-beta-lactamase class B
MLTTRAPLACLYAATAALASLFVGMNARAEPQREIWNQPTEPFHVIGNIYYVGTAGLSSWLITTPQGNFLLDAALEESAPQIEKNIVALGFKLKDIRYLLNTHAHFDHAGGLSQLKKDTGAVLVASEPDRSALEGGFYLGSENDSTLNLPAVKVDRTIADGATLTLGGVTLKANLTPGHTRGCTSWSMQVIEAGKPEQVLFFCSTSVAANRLVEQPQYPGIVADYEKAFAKAKTLQVDVFLAPHAEFFGLHEKHQRQASGGANSFIDPTEFAAFMQRSEADFREQLARQQAAAGPKS